MTMPLRRAGALLVYFSGWTLLALFSASQSMITYSYAGTGTVDRAAVLKVTLPLWYLWALLALGVLWAARRWPIAPGVWRRHLAIHGALTFVFVVLVVALYRALRVQLGLPSRNPFAFDVLTGVHTHVLAYWIVAGVYHVATYYRSAREREVRTAELSAELSQARLDALRMQLHPHFLFNTMHAISSAIREDPEGAENMLAELADLLRTTVDRAATHELRLREELEFTQRYVGIQRVRFGDRLDVRIDVEPAVLDVLVPALILQPLVENAIEHGIAARRRGGRLEIRARARGTALELSVIDDGGGLDTAAPPADGTRVGLRNTRARLAQMYGDAGRLELSIREGGGAAAVVTVPLRAVHAVPA